LIGTGNIQLLKRFIEWFNYFESSIDTALNTGAYKSTHGYDI